jgi:hypothetical protein
MPRNLQNLDLVFGEDPISKFDTVLPIEMYIETFAGWEGASEFISKFGLEIRNKFNVTVAVDRWEKEVKKISSKMWVSSRPQEGDLIYDSITKRIFEIKFVNQDWQFYQLGKMAYAYRLECEMYQFSHEQVSTGVKDIDDAAKDRDTNKLDFQLLLESGDLLLQENEFSIFFDGGTVVSPFDSGTVFQDEGKIIEFHADDPFRS